jgi:hypothetical protein
MDSKNSLEVTQGTTMLDPAAAVIESPSDTDKSSDAEFDVNKPFPTEEEFATLPRVPGSIPWTAWTVAAVEFAERFSYYGTTAVCELEISKTKFENTNYVTQLSTSSKKTFQRGPRPELAFSSSLDLVPWVWDSVLLQALLPVSLTNDCHRT